MGFEAEGFCVVSGPDVVWGRDIRSFHPPAGKFEGIVGGDPCQSHSTLANLVRAKGLEPRFGDMTGEYARVIEEAQPEWFLRENVLRAPDIAPAGYSVTSFVIDNSWLDAGDGIGEEQERKRRFWFGWREERGRAPNLMLEIEFARTRLPKTIPADCGDARDVPVAHGGTKGKVKRTRSPGVTWRHHSNGMGSAHPGNPPNYSLERMLELQGLPPTVLDHAPFTTQGARKLVGNAVPYGMARELARAVRKVTTEGERA